MKLRSPTTIIGSERRGFLHLFLTSYRSYTCNIGRHISNTVNASFKACSNWIFKLTNASLP
jgi:hypothetical protein